MQPTPRIADLILHNGKITTLDPHYPEAQTIAVKDGKIIGVDDAESYERGPETRIIDLNGRRLVPGLNDSHIHVIRGGLNYNMELRWDGVPSLADALGMLKEQAERTPPNQWVRVIGGWTEFQFAEGRMPTLEEINVVSGDTPVFVLHLYDRAFLNRAALRFVGYTKDTPDPPGGEIQRDRAGNPTGLIIARPNAMVLYATLAKGPKLPFEHQVNSTQHFMRELNRLGLTSIIDAGGGFQNYPDDYKVIEHLHERGELTLRFAYNLFTQRPKNEKEDFARWVRMTRPGNGDDFYRVNGAGEMLTFSAADFEDFLEPRPDLSGTLEAELRDVVFLLAQNRWPFRLHATYDESITRFLNVFEEVNREASISDLGWFFDHCETISDRNLERVKALGGGIAIQNRMAFQGEYFVNRYGVEAARRTPPINEMLRMEIPVGAGTDATRVASYNPWLSLYWLATGKTIGGLSLYPESNRLDRLEALRLYTVGSSWFSKEQLTKGAVIIGQLADFAVLTEDYFSIPEEEIKALQSVLTIVGGKVVYAAEEFSDLAPPQLPVLPEWSPIGVYGGYGAPLRRPEPVHVHACSHRGVEKSHSPFAGFWGLGCDCFAF